MLDFDGMMSAVSPAMIGGGTGSTIGNIGGRGGTGSSGSGVTYSSSMAWNHAHSIMGAETISTWNEILKNISAFCELGFHCEHGEEHPESAIKVQKAENDCLAKMCAGISSSVLFAQEDALFPSMVLTGLLNESNRVHQPTKPRMAKRARRSASRCGKTKSLDFTDSDDDEFSELTDLLERRKENYVAFNTDVSVRRWAALAFSWLCKGQKRLLETCTKLLI